MDKIDKELIILYIAYYTGNEHMNSIIEDNKEVPFEVSCLVKKLKKTLSIYIKRIENLKDYLLELNDFITNEANKMKPAKKFEKRIRVDEDGDVVVNGLLTTACLVLQHRNFKNRTLIPDYKLAEKIYLNYEKESDKVLDNSRGLAKTILRKVDNEV